MQKPKHSQLALFLSQCSVLGRAHDIVVWMMANCTSRQEVHVSEWTDGKWNVEVIDLGVKEKIDAMNRRNRDQGINCHEASVGSWVAGLTIEAETGNLLWPYNGGGCSFVRSHHWRRVFETKWQLLSQDNDYFPDDRRPMRRKHWDIYSAQKFPK